MESIDKIESSSGRFIFETSQQEDMFETPRDWDNLGIMVCCHRRYNLGDIQYDEGKHAVFYTLVNDLNYNTEQLRNDLDNMEGGTFIEKYMTKIEELAIVLPLYLYDHSGITISTSPFSCPWDSGQLGFIYATKEATRKEFGVRRIDERIRNNTLDILYKEVEIYDYFLTGEIYEFIIVDVKTDEIMDSCGGYYGQEGYDQIIEEGKQSMHNLEI